MSLEPDQTATIIVDDDDELTVTVERIDRAGVVHRMTHYYVDDIAGFVEGVATALEWVGYSVTLDDQTT